MTRNGWDRDSSWSGGRESGMYCRLSGTGTLTIELDPGIVVGHVEQGAMQTLKEVRLDEAGSPHRPSGEPREKGLGGIDPVRASELLADLARATRTG